MDYAERLDAMRKRISQMEKNNATRRHHSTLRQVCPPLPLRPPGQGPPDDGPLPALPPGLPRPEYAVTANLVSQDEQQVQFYMACEQGLMSQVEAFVQECHPSQAVRQYGLEQASFGNQPAVARYLLEQATTLHDNAFLRCQCNPSGAGETDDSSIFDVGREDPLALVQVFLDFGWHPNQLWHGVHGIHNSPKTPLRESLTNRPLLSLLLSHGADPNFSPHNIGRQPVDRRCGLVLDAAVGQWDPSLIALLVENGAKAAYAQPLHRVVRWMGRAYQAVTFSQRRAMDRAYQAVAFSQRRAMAEYVLSSGMAGVDDVEYIMFFDIVHQPRPRGENLTPFVYACAAQDWDMAKWLLEKGADPNALDGRAFEPMFYMRPYYGPSDPKVVKDLVEKMGKRLGSDEELL